MQKLIIDWPKNGPPSKKEVNNPNEDKKYNILNKYLSLETCESIFLNNTKNKTRDDKKITKWIIEKIILNNQLDI